MDAGTHNEWPDAPQFSAVLRPNRSLSRAGFLILMGSISVVCFGAGLFFAWLGAWPVFGFFGLDVALIYIAFRLNYRSGRQVEYVWLDETSLNVRQVSAGGVATQSQFNAYWVRVTLEEGRGSHLELLLTSHGRRLAIGSFLGHEEKAEFAGVLREALSAHRS